MNQQNKIIICFFRLLIFIVTYFRLSNTSYCYIYRTTFNQEILQNISTTPTTIQKNSLDGFSLFPRERLDWKFFRFNRVDGVTISLGTDVRERISHNSNFFVSGGIGYSFANMKFQGIAGLDYKVQETPIVVGVQFFHKSSSNEGWKLAQNDNTLQALLFQRDYYNYFFTRGAEFHAEYTPADCSRITASVRSEHISPLEAFKIRTFRDLPIQDNITFNPGFMHSISIGGIYSKSLRNGDFTTIFLPELSNSVTVDLHGSITYKFGDYHFTKSTFWSLVNIPFTGLQELAGLKIITKAGHITGNAPESEVFHIGGNGSLPGYRMNEFALTKFVQINPETTYVFFVAGRHFGLPIGLTIFSNVIWYEHNNSILPCDYGIYSSIGKIIHFGIAFPTTSTPFGQLFLRFSTSY